MNKFTVRTAVVVAVAALLMTAACQRSSAPDSTAGSGRGSVDGAGTEFVISGRIQVSRIN